MASRMHGKEERKEEGKRRKRREKEKKRREKLGIKSEKKKKKIRVHLFPLRSRHFLNQSEIRYLEKKEAISTFVFMQDSFDEQII